MLYCQQENGSTRAAILFDDGGNCEDKVGLAFRSSCEEAGSYPLYEYLYKIKLTILH